MKTYYHILNISPRASDEEVRRAWHVLALRWHPDRNPANRIRAQRMFIEINRAYAVLQTRPQREAYTRSLIKKPSRPARRSRMKKLIDCLAEILWPFVVKGAA